MRGSDAASGIVLAVALAGLLASAMMLPAGSEAGPVASLIGEPGLGLGGTGLIGGATPGEAPAMGGSTVQQVCDANLTAAEGEPIAFDAAAHLAGAVANASWDFDDRGDSDGDGNGADDLDAVGATVTHVYGDDGIYLATLRATSAPPVAFDMAWSSPGVNTWDVRAADVDNDGDPDLVVATFDANQVFLNDGTGSFTLAWESAEVEFSSSVAMADFNADGYLDQFVANYLIPTVNRVYLGDGTGAFVPTWQDDRTRHSTQVRVTDFNGDGRPDVLVGNDDDHHVTYLRNESSGFSEIVSSEPPIETFRIEIGDLDGDGKVDYVSREHGRVSFRGGAGNGKFGVLYSYGLYDQGVGLALGDVDGDGDLDVVTAGGGTLTSPGWGAVLKNDGSGNVNLRGTLLDPSNPAWGEFPDLNAGDFDSDGDVDILAASVGRAGAGGPNLLFLNRGNGTMDLAWSSNLSEPTREVESADFNGDGRLDFAEGNAGAPVRVWLGSVPTPREEAMSICVRVTNLPPTLDDLQVYAAADLTLRVAGEKFHDVCLELSQDSAVTGRACVVRMPGSPDRQTATLSGGRIDLLGDTAITLYYTPDDDPVNGQRNGANPAWVILTFADGSEARLHHTFNVRHTATWTWTLNDLRGLLVGKPITFEVAGSDVGSDDLAFDIDFGDGGVFTATVFNDGSGPDPYPSPEVNPITAAVTATHAYAAAGTYVVTVAARDDDGGMAVQTLALTVG